MYVIGIINFAVKEQLLATMLSHLPHLGASLVVEHTAFAATANAAAKAHFVASGLCFVVISSRSVCYFFLLPISLSFSQSHKRSLCQFLQVSQSCFLCN